MPSCCCSWAATWWRARWPVALRPDARATLDNTALMWHYTTAQGLAGMALVRMLPQWMGG